LSEKEMGFPALDDRIDFIYVRPPHLTPSSSLWHDAATSATSMPTSPSARRLATSGITVTAARRIGADSADWPIDDVRAWPSDHFAVSISLRM
jgi:endonuclease/exonuclease/phosphatase family metal-dependent hydrolase